MFSIRRTAGQQRNFGAMMFRAVASAAVAGCGAVAVVGCAPAQPRAEAQPSYTAEPMYTDAAMRQRDFAPTTAWYPTGTVQTLATRWPLENQPQTPIQPLDAVLNPVVFIAQAIMLPVRMIETPPGTRVNQVGQAVPPTYNAMPPLPPEPLPPEAPRPVRHHVARNVKAYRPFGALRDWWSGLFESKPAPRRTRRVSTPVHVVPNEPTSHGALTEPTTEQTTTAPTTEGAPPQTEPTTAPAQTEPASQPQATPSEKETAPASNPSPASGDTH